MKNLGFWFLVGRATALLILATVALTFAQVMLRYIFNSPVAWIEEVSRYLFVWVVFLGSAVAFRTGAHIKIDLVPTLENSWLRIAVVAVRSLITGGALILLLWSGVLVAWRNRYTPSYTLPEVSALFFYGAVPVATLLMIVALSQWFINQLRGSK